MLAAGLLAGLLCAAPVADDRISVDLYSDEARLTLDLGREVQPYATPLRGAEGLLRGEPAWPWRCWLSDPAELSCRAARTLVPAATPFQVELAVALYDRTGERLPAQRWSADTGAPELSFDVRWRGDEPQLVATADQPIDAVSLQQALRLVPAGGAGGAARIEVTALPDDLREARELDGSDASRRFLLELRGVQPGEQYEVQLDAGLRSLEGPLRGEAGRPEAIEIPGPLAVDLQCGDSWQPQTPPCRPEDVLRLRFQGRPHADTLAATIAALQGAGLSTDGELARAWSGDYGPPLYELRVAGLRAAHAYRVQLPVLRAVDSRFDGPPALLAFATRHYQPALRFGPSAALAPESPLLEIVGRRGVALQQTWFDADGDRHARHSRVGRWRTPVEPVELPLPRAPKGLTERGGLELFAARAHAGSAWATRLHAPFALHGLLDAENAWVWLTEWQDARPLAEVRVDLVEQTAEGLQPVAGSEVRSDARGLAQLHQRLPGRWSAERAHTWLRARDGQRTVYLPLALLDSLGEDEGQGGDWEQGELRAFVLSDQPLYAPGDRVRFQAWLRRRDGVRLSAGQLPREVAIALQLSWSWNEAPPDQRFTVSPEGLVSGELRLPEHAANDAWTWKIVSVDGEDITTHSLFNVSRSEPLTLDVDLLDPPVRLRPGRSAEVGVRADYFSGGAAAGIEVGASGIARPGSGAEVFADWPDYEFANPRLDAQGDADCEDGDGDLAHTFEFPDTTSDATGQARRDVPVRLGCAFGVLEIAARASLPALGVAYGPTRRIPLLADREHLGLRVRGADGDQLEIQAVLLDGEARVRAAAPLRLRLERWRAGGWQDDGECSVRADGVDACYVAAGGSLRVHTRHAGREHLLEHWDWRSGPADSAALVAAWSADGARLRFRVAPLPAPAGSALLSIEQGTLVDARVLRWQAGGFEGELLRTDLPPGDFDLGVLLAPASADGARSPPRRLRTRVAAPTTPEPAWLRLEAPDDGLEPGRRQRLSLHNDGREALDLAVTVVDAGLAALAADIDAERDPNAGEWARSLREFASLMSFSIAHPGDGSVAHLLLRGGRLKRSDAEAFDDDSVAMEKVEVTGSRISAEDVYFTTTRSRPGERSRASETTLADALRPYAGALRRRFATQAHWQAGVRLAPGEQRDIELTLPDNLTAWRVEAVAFASSGHAERQLLTLRAARPLEVRPSLPAVSIAGDQLQASAGFRNAADSAQSLRAELHLRGPHVEQSLWRTLPLATRASAGMDLLALAAEPGRVQLLAAAKAGEQRDAALVEALVAAPTRTRTASDAWWLPPGRSQRIDLSAHTGVQSLTLRVGLDALPMLDVFAQRVRDYPHRCHEQIVSRAQAAALLRAGRPALAAWADESVIDAAWRERSGLLDGDNLPVYFDPDNEHADDFLPAYVAVAAQRLVELGYAAAALDEDLRGALERHLPQAARRALERGDFERAALNLEAMRGLGKADPGLEARWWQGLPKFGPLAAAVALDSLAGTADDAHQAALLALVDGWAGGREAVPPWTREDGHFSQRSMLGHCRLAAALATQPALVERARRWYAGVASQYGDAVGEDSLALAACIDAGLRVGRALGVSDTAHVQFEQGDQRERLELDRAHPSATRELTPTGARDLTLRSDTGLYAALDVVRVVDARNEAAQSLGASLTRIVEVRRGERWEAAPARLKRGDWVRVRLLLETPRAFDMLVLEEAVPGALRPVDTTLQAVADPWIRGQDEQDPWFHTRQLGQPVTRFYATWLPPGRHQFGYIAEVRFAGDYAWLPAAMQPMYGRVQRAQTAATRLRVDP